MDTPQDAYNDKFVKMLDTVSSFDLKSSEATTAMKNLEIFSKCRPPITELEPTCPPDPTTVWGKVRLGTARAWDNETTRVLLKAGGSFAGVALVVWSTIHKDHVMERQALAQANQRPS